MSSADVGDGAAVGMRRAYTPIGPAEGSALDDVEAAFADLSTELGRSAGRLVATEVDWIGAAVAAAQELIHFLKNAEVAHHQRAPIDGMQAAVDDIKRRKHKRVVRDWPLLKKILSSMNKGERDRDTVDEARTVGAQFLVGLSAHLWSRMPDARRSI